MYQISSFVGAHVAVAGSRAWQSRICIDVHKRSERRGDPAHVFACKIFLMAEVFESQKEVTIG